ncbi:hypothetical protein K431DRAFT_286905 [Polychaeton citri CBS 116435]|uniref:Uncharacterized protein n=1 Tax=Polychaeton citri CBS 116435 TaxID=1314669 RepID=A0A9P4UN08_9PEZI|nr:hypothetical protein K431DRAFT_286905 [Polychaeton citri CBS 116435]
MHHAAGIILSISIITALGLAVYENPQVQAWFEEQRRNLVELLRSIGSDLDPETRRQAEAIAYDGITPAADDEKLKREAAGSRDAAAVATGRSTSNASTVRRIPVQGPPDPQAAEERRRQGREYLARRNQTMMELQERKRSSAEGDSTPPTPTSFDAMVDQDGKLKSSTRQLEPSADTSFQSTSETALEAIREVQRISSQPLHASGFASSSSGWQSGSHLANPFSDEYALDRSDTPKPPVPPKIQLDASSAQSEPSTDTPSLRFASPRPIAPSERSSTPLNTEGLTYEEQLAIALSLSDQDSLNSATVRRRHSQREDDQLQAAIQASLREMDHHQAAYAIANVQPLTPQPKPRDTETLVDLTPDPPVSLPVSTLDNTNPWEALFTLQSHSQQLAALDPPTSVPTVNSEDDELYRLTPELTRARLASLEQQTSPQMLPSSRTLSRPSAPYDPVHEAAELQSQQVAPEASFYSAVSSAPSVASTHTLSNTSEQPQLIDMTEVPHSTGARTATTVASQAASNADTFTFMSATQSAPSHASSVEVLDVEIDSDDDVMSDDGIATPDSWTEVGSRDGESEMSDADDSRPQPAH